MRRRASFSRTRPGSKLVTDQEWPASETQVLRLLAERIESQRRVRGWLRRLASISLPGTRQMLTTGGSYKSQGCLIPRRGDPGRSPQLGVAERDRPEMFGVIGDTARGGDERTVGAVHPYTGTAPIRFAL